MIELDTKINKRIKYLVPLFSNIHPNIITIIGIFMNGMAFYAYFNLNNKKWTAIFLVLRILCDNLDGIVARTYNKVSKLGGLLDGIADCLLVSTLLYGLFKKFSMSENLRSEGKIVLLENVTAASNMIAGTLVGASGTLIYSLTSGTTGFAATATLNYGFIGILDDDISAGDAPISVITEGVFEFGLAGDSTSGGLQPG